MPQSTQLARRLTLTDGALYDILVHGIVRERCRFDAARQRFVYARPAWLVWRMENVERIAPSVEHGRAYKRGTRPCWQSMADVVCGRAA